MNNDMLSPEKLIDDNEGPETISELEEVFSFISEQQRLNLQPLLVVCERQSTKNEDKLEVQSVQKQVKKKVKARKESPVRIVTKTQSSVDDEDQEMEMEEERDQVPFELMVGPLTLKQR